jgi:hypothetical protein
MGDIDSLSRRRFLGLLGAGAGALACSPRRPPVTIHRQRLRRGARRRRGRRRSDRRLRGAVRPRRCCAGDRREGGGLAAPRRLGRSVLRRGRSAAMLRPPRARVLAARYPRINPALIDPTSERYGLDGLNTS